MKRKWMTILFFLTCVSFVYNRDIRGGNLSVSTLTSVATHSFNNLYTYNLRPLTSLIISRVTVPQIPPEGWIRKYLVLQRDNFTGNLGNTSVLPDKNKNSKFSIYGIGDQGCNEIPFWNIDQYG